MKPFIQIKRAYEVPEHKDGFRILVDRIWPRGVKKEDASIDEWAKEIAPSTELRKWFGHDPARWDEFKVKYRAELKRSSAIDGFVEAHEHRETITLVYAARDVAHTHALVLQEYLNERYSE